MSTNGGFLLIFSFVLDICSTFAPAYETRAFSSAGLEHLPYKQRVGGSNPSTPTRNGMCSVAHPFFVIILDYIWENQKKVLLLQGKTSNIELKTK